MESFVQSGLTVKQSRRLFCMKEYAFLFSFSLQSVFFDSHDGGTYHVETSPLICSANQWTVFYMIGSSIMKGLIEGRYSY